MNGLVVPGRSIERTLARHAFNLVVNNDHDTYKVSLVGSSTAVKFNGRYILLCTNHQLVGVDMQQVAMLKDDGSVLVTSGGSRFYSQSSDTDAYDLVAFDFTEPVAAHPDLKKRFFNLLAAPPDTLNTNILAMLLTGFPTKKQKYELEDKNHLGIARLNVACIPDSQPADLALLRVRPDRELTISPDGMSGGSAFVIQLVNWEPHAYFAGIIVRGGTSGFYVLKAGFVIAFLNSVFEQHPSGG
ncbi:hypothetical protein ASD83_15600 [Devosia sp. Root685]|nr:hypothetical protein ASD83_15600 [Devosia sp. Root685]